MTNTNLLVLLLVLSFIDYSKCCGTPFQRDGIWVLICNGSTPGQIPNEIDKRIQVCSKFIFDLFIVFLIDNDHKSFFNRTNY